MIPVDLRKDSEIAPSEKLMVLRRRDWSNIALVKLNAMDDLMRGFQKMKTSSQR